MSIIGGIPATVTGVGSPVQEEVPQFICTASHEKYSAPLHLQDKMVFSFFSESLININHKRFLICSSAWSNLVLQVTQQCLPWFLISVLWSILHVLRIF